MPRRGSTARIEELTERHFDWTFNLNVRAFFKLVKLLMARFSRGSSIVAVSSWGALRALPCYSLVGSSKGALEALARHLAVELAPRGIRVNILTAGAVLTDAWKAMPDGEDAHRRDHPPHARRALGHSRGNRVWGPIPLLRCGLGVIGQTLVLDNGLGIMA